MAAIEVHTVRIKGSLGLRDAANLAKELLDAITAHDVLLVDASELTAIDVTNLQILVAAHKTAQGRGASLNIHAAHDGVLDLALRRIGIAAATDMAPVWENDVWTSLATLENRNAAA
ncbi:MAG TPA: STAS domain-containing protein [Arsenicitalea sp.]|jgi:ABC-type transporter Mla MlaB component|nr:STAS domain-containing protein [Arsenicitalea sp.]